MTKRQTSKKKEFKESRTLLITAPPLWAQYAPRQLITSHLYPVLRQIKYQHVIIPGFLLTLVLLMLLTLSFFVPSRLTFSLADKTCGFNPVIMPKLTQHNTSASYKSESTPTISIAGYPVFSRQTCITATNAPTSSRETIRISPFGLPFPYKHVSVSPPELPELHARFTTSQAVGAASSLPFELTSADRIFDYRLTSADKSALCQTSGVNISCSLADLKLSQGTAHQIKLQRVFNTEVVGTVFDDEIKILDPVVIVSSSIGAGSMVYDSPTSLTLTTNKKLVFSQNVILVNTTSGEQISTIQDELTDESIIISFNEPLTRLGSYELRVGRLQAEDGSELTDSYVHSFTTSGGPKITNASIGSTRVNPSSNVTLTFDIGLKPGQEFAKFVQIELGGKSIAASISHTGNQLVLNPRADLPRCAAFSVKVTTGLMNKFDIGGGEAWQLNSRTLCQTAISIGRSAQGRAITGYRFGTGASKIVFVGGMHGNEKSSVATMSAWVQYLEDNGHKIPAHRSIIVIPNHNPDGYAGSRRTNANTVDLNRNFPSNDWSSSIQMPGGQNLPQGGGVTPLDQPESSALAGYIQRERPRLVLTYHAVARIVISNDAGDSIARSQQYATDSGYRFVSNANSGGTFEYATTGEFEDWLADKLGIAAILIELGTMSSNEINTHRSAMWNLVQLP